jgi:hypothetical protein
VATGSGIRQGTAATAPNPARCSPAGVVRPSNAAGRRAWNRQHHRSRRSLARRSRVGSLERFFDSRSRPAVLGSTAAPPTRRGAFIRFNPGRPGASNLAAPFLPFSAKVLRSTSPRIGLVPGRGGTTRSTRRPTQRAALSFRGGSQSLRRCYARPAALPNTRRRGCYQPMNFGRPFGSQPAALFVPAVVDSAAVLRWSLPRSNGGAALHPSLCTKLWVAGGRNSRPPTFCVLGGPLSLRVWSAGR